VCFVVKKADGLRTPCGKYTAGDSFLEITLRVKRLRNISLCSLTLTPLFLFYNLDDFLEFRAFSGFQQLEQSHFRGCELSARILDSVQAHLLVLQSP